MKWLLNLRDVLVVFLSDHFYSSPMDLIFLFADDTVG